MFKDKILLITGGTGSFGNAVLNRFLRTDLKEIRIFSRDEKKQDDMRKKYNDSKIKYYIGDVRDIESLENAINGVDYIFHAAALKQVPSCEFYPVEAIKTNILGTENVLNVAIKNGVKKVVCLSTDKAVYPINAMGISKAMMEKLAIAKSRTIDNSKTIISCTRYGNVMASRGSVIPLFIQQICENLPITITDPDMTRFMMSLEESVDLVIFAFNNAQNGDIFVQKSSSATVLTIANAVKKMLKKEDHPIKIIGTRHGEKLYETLLTREEMVRAIEMEKFYRIPSDNRDLNYKNYLETGKEVLTESHEYNSHNTNIMNCEELTKILKSLEELK